MIWAYFRRNRMYTDSIRNHQWSFGMAPLIEVWIEYFFYYFIWIFSAFADDWRIWSNVGLAFLSEFFKQIPPTTHHVHSIDAQPIPTAAGTFRIWSLDPIEFTSLHQCLRLCELWDHAAVRQCCWVAEKSDELHNRAFYLLRSHSAQKLIISPFANIHKFFSI